MKKVFLATSIMAFLLVNTVSGQDIRQSQVPSIVVNNFQKAFHKARDVEWEMDGENYKVEFETGLLGRDHSAWYTNAGKLIRHKEEISERDLPQSVSAKIKSEFASYRADDVEKITEGDRVTYRMELKKQREEWKVAFDAAGNILTKIAD